MNPNRPKKATATEKLAAENRALRKTVTSSIGSRRRRSHQMKVANSAAKARKPAMVSMEVHPLCGASITVNTSSAIAATELTRPIGSRRPAPGSFDDGSSRRAQRQRDEDDRDVDQEHRSPPEVLQQQAAGDGTECHGEAAGRRPDADGLRPLAGLGEDVGEDGERGGEHERGADAHGGPGGDEPFGAAGEGSPAPRSRRTAPGRSASHPCARTGRRGSRTPAAGRRRRGRRRRRSTGAGWWWRRARG